VYRQCLSKTRGLSKNLLFSRGRGEWSAVGQFVPIIGRGGPRLENGRGTMRLRWLFIHFLAVRRSACDSQCMNPVPGAYLNHFVLRRLELPRHKFWSYRVTMNSARDCIQVGYLAVILIRPKSLGFERIRTAFTSVEVVAVSGAPSRYSGFTKANGHVNDRRLFRWLPLSLVLPSPLPLQIRLL